MKKSKVNWLVIVLIFIIILLQGYIISLYVSSDGGTRNDYDILAIEGIIDTDTNLKDAVFNYPEGTKPSDYIILDCILDISSRNISCNIASNVWNEQDKQDSGRIQIMYDWYRGQSYTLHLLKRK